MKNLFTLLALFFLSTTVFCQDEILGKWYTEENKSVIEIYEKDKKYFAKVFSIKDGFYEDGTHKLDKKNPDKKLRSRRILGVQIMKDLVYDAKDKEWNDGNIYDPESGNTYSVFLRLETPTKLYLKGYIGFSWIGRSSYWTRKPQ